VSHGLVVPHDRFTVHPACAQNRCHTRFLGGASDGRAVADESVSGFLAAILAGHEPRFDRESLWVRASYFVRLDTRI